MTQKCRPYRDVDRTERRVPLASDKMAAQTLLNELLQKVDRQRAGLVDPSDEQRGRPLSEHLADFKKHLQNKGVSRTVEILHLSDRRDSPLNARYSYPCMSSMRRSNMLLMPIP